MNNSITTHDVVMIGAGQAALTAAIYTTREEIDTVLYEKAIVGGLAATTDWIDNYPGYAQGIEGIRLADELRGQAERFGAKISFGEVQKIERSSTGIHVTTDSGEVHARAVLIATGSDHRANSAYPAKQNTMLEAYTTVQRVMARFIKTNDS